MAEVGPRVLQRVVSRPTVAGVKDGSCVLGYRVEPCRGAQARRQGVSTGEGCDAGPMRWTAGAL